MTTAEDEVTRALTNRGSLAELADEAKALDKISRKSRDPAELVACAKRAGETSLGVRNLQGMAVREIGRLLRELQAAPGFNRA